MKLDRAIDAALSLMLLIAFYGTCQTAWQLGILKYFVSVFGIGAIVFVTFVIIDLWMGVEQ